MIHPSVRSQDARSSKTLRNSVSISKIKLLPKFFEKERVQFSRGDLVDIRSISKAFARHLREVIAYPESEISRISIGGNEWYSVCAADKPIRLPTVEHKSCGNLPRQYVFTDWQQAYSTAKLTDLYLSGDEEQPNSILEDDDTPQKLFVFPWFKTELIQNYELERRSTKPHVFLTYSNGFVRIYQLNLVKSSSPRIQLALTAENSGVNSTITTTTTATVSITATRSFLKYPQSKKYILLEITQSIDRDRLSFKIPVAFDEPPEGSGRLLRKFVESPVPLNIIEFANNYSYHGSNSKPFRHKSLDTMKVRGKITRKTARLWDYYYDLDYSEIIS